MWTIAENEYVDLRQRGVASITNPNNIKELEALLNKKYENINNFLKLDYDEINEWQLERIKFLVDYAYENIPLYTKKYNEVGYIKGSINSWKDFYKLPILYKEELIEGFPNQIAIKKEDFIFSTRSSGSSGKFVTIAVSKEAIYIDTLQTIRQFMMQSNNNYYSDDKILYIYTCPWWITDINGKYIQEFLPTTSKIECIVEKLNKIRPKFISTYPTYLEKMAINNIDLSLYGVELVIVHSEQSTKVQREELSKKLNVKILDEYSSEELTRIALECPEHQYHFEEDACYVEIVDIETKERIKNGNLGLVVGTNLLNVATPIIRYCQGDLATISNKKDCICGSNARIMEKVEGRIMDSIIIDKNNFVPASCFMDLAYNWFLDYNIPIHGVKYQFIQKEKNELCLCLILGKYDLNVEAIKKSIYTLIPKYFNIEISIVDELLYQSTKKYRPVINLLTKKENKNE